MKSLSLSKQWLPWKNNTRSLWTVDNIVPLPEFLSCHFSKVLISNLPFYSLAEYLSNWFRMDFPHCLSFFRCLDWRLWSCFPYLLLTAPCTTMPQVSTVRTSLFIPCQFAMPTVGKLHGWYVLFWQRQSAFVWWGNLHFLNSHHLVIQQYGSALFESRIFGLLTALHFLLLFTIS